MTDRERTTLNAIDTAWRAGDRKTALARIADALTDPCASALVHAVGAQLRLAFGDLQLAHEELERALAQYPNDPRLRFLAAECARRRGDKELAVTGFERALALAPGFVEAAMFLGNLRFELGDYPLAIAAQRRALELAPQNAAAHYNLAVSLAAQENHAEALELLANALRLAPDYVAVHRARGASLLALDRPQDARQAYTRAVTADPGNAAGWVGLARSQLESDPAEAASAFERALSIEPGLEHERLELASLFVMAGRREQSIQVLQVGLRVQPHQAELHAYLATLLLAQSSEAAAQAARELARWSRGEARHEVLILYALGRVADWTDRARRMNELPDAIGIGQGDAASRTAFADPGMTLYYLSLYDDPALLQSVARSYVRSLPVARAAAPVACTSRRRSGARLTVAYVSGDFRDHPVATSLVEVIESHSRDNVRVLGVSLAPSDGSAIAKRIRAAFDEVVDAQTLSDAALVAQLRARDVDVAVDLVGHTAAARPGIWAAGVAPVQAAYLGFAGTLGAAWTNYLIADSETVPACAAQYYDEAIVRMPVSFFPSDRRERDADRLCTSRAAEGLPDSALVLCCFVNPGRYTPELFEIWLGWLTQCPRAILWLQGSERVAERLRAYASRVAPGLAEQIVFARFAATRAEHLARHRLADLFIDVFPYNAHSTARDALWMGLPLLTCAGRSFASRVGASLLRAAGFPTLVAEGLEAYRRRGSELLANDGAELTVLREQVADVRDSALFDTPRLVAELEWAYRAMSDHVASGKSPAPIDVPLAGVAL